MYVVICQSAAPHNTLGRIGIGWKEKKKETGIRRQCQMIWKHVQAETETTKNNDKNENY